MTHHLHAECMRPDYDIGMPMTIQIRDVADEDYMILRTRAAMEGLSLTAYLKRELHRLATSPSMAELLARADERRARGGAAERGALETALAEDRDEREQR